MRKNFILLFLSLFTIFFSQNNKLEGRWILDKETELDGNLLPINDYSFSHYEDYKFVGNKMLISGLEMPVTISANKIKTPGSDFEYLFNGKYLILKNIRSKRIYWLLRPDSFIELYPEFRPKEIKIGDRIVYRENMILIPDFNYEGGFNGYLKKISDNYNFLPHTDDYSIFEFIITKDSKMEDIKIIESFSKDFDEILIRQLKNAEKLFRNVTGKDILFQRKQKFKVYDGMFVSSNISSDFDISKDKKNNSNHKEMNKIVKIYEKGNSFYLANNFKKAVETYEQIETLGSVSDSEMLESIYIRLGVSHLANETFSAACESFNKAGGITNFKSRNYLLNFCTKK